MKTIEVKDEVYDFLMDLSKELNTQDNRATASPYFYQIEEEETVPASDGNGEFGFYNDGDLIHEDEDIKDIVFEYKEWDLENPEHQKLFEEMDSYEISDLMVDTIGYQKVWFEKRKIYRNAFLTEKACKKHIESNDYHYSNPKDYLSYAFRNPELENLLLFVKSLNKQ